MSNYSFKRKNERPWPNERLGLAAIVGHTTPTSTRLWVRTNDEHATEGAYQLLLFDKNTVAGTTGQTLGELFETLRSEEEVELKALDPFGPRPINSEGEKSDTTCVMDIPDLKPGVNYSYAIWSERDKAFVLGHDKRRRVRTPLEEGGFAFGLFSCHNPFGKAEEIPTNIGVKKQPKLHNMGLWDTARIAFEREHNGQLVDFVIAGGDQAYSDGCVALSIWGYLEKIVGQRRADRSIRLPNQTEMLSWFRDMYRGYWGFPSVRAVFGRFPTYMIWDDHEIRDGWGSHKIRAADGDNEINEVLFDDWEECLDRDEAEHLLKEMFAAAKQAYFEYEHCHNPPTAEGVYDYQFTHKDCLFYVLDGRGQRDFEREEYKILGKEQMGRFRAAVDGMDSEKTPILFVVSAVPLLHASSWSVGRAEGVLADYKDLTDDLRDAWEHKGHTKERQELLDTLFRAADKGIKVCILSGDVHMSAVFEMRRGSSAIYQLTSSAITYNTPAMLGWALGTFTVARSNDSTEDNYEYRRRLLETDPSFAIIVVSGNDISFQLYGDKTIEIYKDASSGGSGPRENGQRGARSRRNYATADTETIRIFHSTVKVDLDFSQKG